MWLWHAVEEVEHKNVAFDVYQHLYSDYGYRVYGMLSAMIHLTNMVRGSYMVLLKADGSWGKVKTHQAIRQFALRLFGGALSGILKHALPWHHPSHVANPAWIREWVALYDTGEEGLAKLDTTKLSLSPREMLRA
jgi:uncharacterized protein